MLKMVGDSMAMATQVAERLCDLYGCPHIDLNAIEPDPSVLRFVSLPLLTSIGVFPVYERNDVLHVAVAHPADKRALQSVARVCVLWFQ